ncbi:MAG: hypothetical protein P1U56_12075 [Saprospiraceae bacterium]|nr:hypothetical protein [Saprospiraceae bacterium]
MKKIQHKYREALTIIWLNIKRALEFAPKLFLYSVPGGKIDRFAEISTTLK